MSANPLIEFQDVSFAYATDQMIPFRRAGQTRSRRAGGSSPAARDALTPTLSQREREKGELSQGETRGEGQPPALRDVTLRVEEGEYLAILGHNGSGKSTVALHCNALLTPDSGRVLVAGMDTRDRANRQAVRDAVGLVFQNPDNQIIATVVEDDVAWTLAMRGLPAPLIRARVDWAVDAVGISDLRGLPPHKLSGGQRQRVAIAGVLALRPRCIVADEPTALLDPVSKLETTDLMRQLNMRHGITVIQVTHLLEEAVLADRVVVMEDGRVALEGRPVEVFSDLQQLRALHLSIPEPLELASRLRAAGVPLSPDALTVESIAQELAG